MNELESKEVGVPESGSLCEVYSGIQGEGLLVGERQIFVRFAGCNLDCSFCDTPSARVPEGTCRIEQTPGLRDFTTARNPLTPVAAVSYIECLETSPRLHHSVAFTGGEPLVQADFVAQVARELKDRDFRVFLETNGSLPDALMSVVGSVDMVSMDMKLPGTAGGPDLFTEHELFLRRAAPAGVFVKVVVTSATSADELLRAADTIKAVDPGIPLVLQPVTPQPGVSTPTAAQVLDWQAQCRLHLHNVRVIPQCHKIVNQV